MSDCEACGDGEVPGTAFWIPWCDPCLTEFLLGSESIEAFVTRKKAGHDLRS